MNCFTLHAQHEAQLACEHKRKTRQTQCRQVGARLRDDSSPSRIKGLEFKFSSFESKQDLRESLQFKQIAASVTEAMVCISRLPSAKSIPFSSLVISRNRAKKCRQNIKTRFLSTRDINDCSSTS